MYFVPNNVSSLFSFFSILCVLPILESKSGQRHRQSEKKSKGNFRLPSCHSGPFTTSDTLRTKWIYDSRSSFPHSVLDGPHQTLWAIEAIPMMRERHMTFESGAATQGSRGHVITLLALDWPRGPSAQLSSVRCNGEQKRALAKSFSFPCSRRTDAWLGNGRSALHQLPERTGVRC